MMAKIYEESITIKLSVLEKDNTIADRQSLVTDDITSALESVVEELLNDKSVVVEVSTN